jgi:hypothetical protein
MNKTARWTLLITLTIAALLIGWNTTQLVSSQSSSKNTKSESNRKAKQTRGSSAAVDEWAKNAFDVLDLGKAEERSLFVDGDDQGLEGDEDPDLPPWLAGKIDKGTYLQMRGDNIDMLRGRPFNLPYDPRVRAIREMEKQEAALKQRSAPESLSVWTALGPHPIPNGQTSDTAVPVSGRTISIAIHPTDPDTVYVGTANGGIWKTTNGGTNWTSLFDLQLQSMAIGAITIDPTDSSIVYVGTGENGFSGDSFVGVGLYIIRNANSASPTLNGPFNLDGSAADVLTGRAIGRILVNPADNNTIFVCTTSAIGGNPGAGPFAIPSRGIYRSTNAQSATPTFNKIAITGVVNQSANVVDMVMDPGDGNVIVASVVGATSDGGLYRTADALSATPTFARTRTLPDGATNGRAELDINRNGAVVTVYAAVGQTSTIALGGPANCAASRSGYVTKSVDGGATWSTPMAGSTGFCGGQCFYDIAIAATKDNSTIHLGGAARGGAATCLIDVMKRSTGGGSFVRNDSTLHADEHALAIAPSNQNVVYTSSDGGIWRSADNGTTWVSKNNFEYTATQFQGLSLHPFDRYFTIGGTQDNGTNCLAPDGVTWSHCRDGDGGYTLIDNNALDTTNVTMYHTFFNQSNNQIAFERADDTSFAWTFRGCSGAVSNNGMTCGDTVLFYAPMAKGPGNPNTIYFGTDRLYRSVNRGDLMALVSQGPLVAGQPLTTIGISPQNDNVRIVGLRNGQVFATTTGSTTLTNVTGANFPPVNPNDNTRKAIGRAVIDPNNPNTAYVTFASYFDTAVPLDQHIFKTINLNNATPTWTAAGNGIPNIPVSAFVVDPQDSNRLYAGSDIGVYQSTDGGANWTPLGTGLPRAPVFDMEISNVHRVLRIATHGRGLYEIDIPGQKLPIIRAGGNGGTGPGGASALVAEACAPNNGAIDSGEVVTISFGIKNLGGGPTTNLVATLQPTGGVMLSAGPQVQNYGAIPAGGTVTRNFTFTATGQCDKSLTPTFQIQDGATNFGILSVTYTLGALVTGAPAFAENFDAAVPPALPAGWATVVNAGTVTPWTTTTAFSDSAPNSAATDGSATPADNSLTTPTIAIPVAPAGVNPGVRLSFSNYYNTEGGFDGGVLEISINGGAFADIITAGGSFVSGGYNTSIGATDSVLTGRQAWSGNSNGFINTTVILPPASYGQNAQLRWRTAYDTGTNPAGGGMRVDTVSVFTASRICCGAPTAAPATISGRVTTADGTPVAGVSLNLSGARTTRAITDAAGNYRFSNVDTDAFYSITPALVNYHFAPESRSFSLLANMTDAVFTATPDLSASGNAIDTPDYFVRQHYLDFLGREPDDSGFNFWSDQMTSCGRDASCFERRRINVSAAYFLSIEFQETGGLVDGLNRASYGRAPRYAEFMPDTATVARDVIVGRAGWAQTLEANKQAFVAAWMDRADFRAAYDGLANSAFVDSLISHAGAGFNGDRAALVTGLTNGSLTRAAVLRQVVENEGFTHAKHNEMFVMMEYFGYLRRDPDASGYQFWLNKLNQFGGNFEQAEMVKAFINSGEYRQRFGQ